MKEILKRFFAPDLLLAQTQRDLASEDRDYWQEVAADYAEEKRILEQRLRDETARNRVREQQLLNSILFVVKAPTVDLSNDLAEAEKTNAAAAIQEATSFYSTLPGNLTPDEKETLWRRAAEIADQKFEVVTRENIFETYELMLAQASHYLED